MTFSSYSPTMQVSDFIKLFFFSHYRMPSKCIIPFMKTVVWFQQSAKSPPYLVLGQSEESADADLKTSLQQTRSPTWTDLLGRITINYYLSVLLFLWVDYLLWWFLYALCISVYWYFQYLGLYIYIYIATYL